MKIIRDIALYLDNEEELKKAYQAGNELEHKNLMTYTSDFAFHCRFIGNYLRRSVKQIKFEPVGYNRIAISACLSQIKSNILFENVLIVSIPFNKDYYESLSKEEAINYFIELYKEGIIKTSETHEVPLEFLLEELQKFKNNNYLNEWEFKTKRFNTIGIKATLFCKMTRDSFSLFLILLKKKEIVFKEEILNTLPDEIIFHYRFKDIVLEGNEIKVLDRFEQPLYTLDLTFTL